MILAKSSIFLLTIVVTCSNATHVLFMMPLATKSETHLLNPMVKAMLDKGHHVTLVTPASSSIQDKKLFEIVPVTPFDMVDLNPKHDNVIDMRRQKDDISQFIDFNMSFVTSRCHQTYKNEAFKTHVMDATTPFDLVVTGAISNECFLGVIHKLKAPFIGISSMPPVKCMIDPTGFRTPLSFVPIAAMDFTDKMTLGQRAINAFASWFLELIVMDFTVYPTSDQIIREYIGENVPSVASLRRDINMIFVNTHFSINFPRPYLPDVVEIGGIHCHPPKPLQQDIEKFVSEAKHGVIYFSLGTVFQERTMPTNLTRMFTSVFSRLKQRVLWKWASDPIPGLSENVKTSKWLQQQDVLGHPNVKLFISHGGLLSTQEATYHGVPILGIPLFVDQDSNVKVAERQGYAIKLELLELTEDILERAINDMLNDPKYMENVKRTSEIFRDQPQTPLERATYWMEYLIKHKGASHLRSASRDLSYFQYHMYDVQLIFLGVLALLLLIVWKTVAICCKFCCHKREADNRKMDMSKKHQ